METITFKRTEKVLAVDVTFEQAVTLLIHDTFEAYPDEHEGDVEDYLSDMSAVFEAENILTALADDESITVGEVTYTRNPKTDCLKCPMCEVGHMPHTVSGTAHIYSCEDCPAILLEYVNKSDLEGFNLYLKI